VVVVAMIVVIVMPLPAAVLDVLLACNLTLAVIVVVTTLQISRPLDFSVFPTLLLGTTLLRLALNVASTRLILTRGAIDGTQAAGQVIEMFGQFVSGGSVVVGIVLFAILVTVQFVVITKGATRISEVAARFVLDGMPGRQMAVDADLNAGLIRESEALRRRDEIVRQADFYGAMDGASRFVRGDAIAAILITLINIVGGLYVGMIEHGLSPGDTVRIFTTLTVGDGLVSQLPAFLITLAAGLMVARASSAGDLSREFIGQVFGTPAVMTVAAGFVCCMYFAGLPALPTVVLTSACLITGSVLGPTAAPTSSDERASAVRVSDDADVEPEDRLAIQLIEIQAGVRLTSLLKQTGSDGLLERITRIRSRMADERGLILPKVRMRDHLQLPPRGYRILIRDAEINRGEIHPDGFLAIETDDVTSTVPGIDTRDPVRGRPARWIEPDARPRAEQAGYLVVSPSAVIATHLADIVNKHSHELLTRQHVHLLLARLQRTAPRLVDDLVPGEVTPALLHNVLARLLLEGVSIRDLESILETLGDYAPRTGNPVLLTEYARLALARSICHAHRDDARHLHALTIDPAVEDVLASGFDFNEQDLVVRLSSEVIDRIGRILGEKLAATNTSPWPVIVCSPEIRAGLRKITQRSLSEAVILSLNEITSDTHVEVAGHLSIDELAAGSIATAA